MPAAREFFSIYAFSEHLDIIFRHFYVTSGQNWRSSSSIIVKYEVILLWLYDIAINKHFYPVCHWSKGSNYQLGRKNSIFLRENSIFWLYMAHVALWRCWRGPKILKKGSKCIWLESAWNFESNDTLPWYAAWKISEKNVCYSSISTRKKWKNSPLW